MANYTKLARPYARAVFEYAVEHKHVPYWSDLLQALAAILSQPEVFNLLSNPIYKPEQLASLCFGLVQKDWQLESKNFIFILAESDRLKLIPDIAKLFAEYRAEIEKKVEVKVSSVVALSTEYKNKLTVLLQEKLGKQIDLQCEIDPTLLGGLLIRAGDQVIDASVRGQLSRLREMVLQ